MNTMIRGRLVSRALLLLGVVLGAAAPARADGPCRIEDLEGSFGGSFDAAVRDAAGPLSGPAAAQTRLEIARDGTITGSDVVNFNGMVFRRTFAGRGTLAADCTGSATVTITSSTPDASFPPLRVSFVVTDRFRDIRLIFDDPVIIAAGVFRRL